MRLVIIYLFSIYFSLFLYENYFYFSDYLNLKKDLKILYEIKKKNFEKKINFQPTYNYYLQELKKNKDLKVFISPSYYINKNVRTFPLSSFHYSETVLCNEEGKFISYFSDRYGFNNEDQEWDKKKINTILIGDSFGHGFCVNREDNILSKLKNYSNSKNDGFLNLSSGGTGTLIQYASLLEYFPLDKKVDKVIWLITAGDLINLKNENQNEILNKYVINKKFRQNLKKKSFEINEIHKKFLKIEIENKKNFKKENAISIAIKHNENKINLLKKIYSLSDNIKLNKFRSNFLSREKKIINALPSNQNEEIFLELIKNAENFLNSQDTNLYIFFLNTSIKKIDSKILKLLNSNNIKVVNILESLSNRSFHSMFPFYRRIEHFGGHFSAEGYDYVSKIITSNIN